MQIEVEDIVELRRPRVRLADQRAKGKGSGIEVEIRSHNVYTFRDGNVSRLQLFIEREPAMEAAGLSQLRQEETR